MTKAKATVHIFKMKQSSLTCKRLWRTRSRCSAERRRDDPWQFLFIKSIRIQMILLQSNRSENKKEKNSPQMMSSVQRATYGKRLILSRLLATMSWWASFNFSTSTTLCLLKMSIKSSKILKWNVGVNIFRRPCHLLPVEVSKPVLSQGWRYWYSRDLSISLLLPSNALKHSMGKWKDKS